jgi:microsomal dipeptidase-like Zn-dependent dipeptidase
LLFSCQARQATIAWDCRALCDSIRAGGGLSRLLAALRRITTEENVRKIAGENWLRGLAQAKVG